ncbi:hypothetical protein BT69DRAFT_1350938 [Atractiella rhizophila]|nr:hypothetical protein BT69DRAFT_1350938 [Atractiella rhizophila]
MEVSGAEKDLGNGESIIFRDVTVKFTNNGRIPIDLNFWHHDDGEPHGSCSEYESESSLEPEVEGSEYDDDNSSGVSGSTMDGHEEDEAMKEVEMEVDEEVEMKSRSEADMAVDEVIPTPGSRKRKVSEGAQVRAAKRARSS